MICVLYMYTYIGVLRDTRWAYGPGVIPLRYAVIFGTLEENRLPNLTSYRKTPSGWWLQPLKNISQLGLFFPIHGKKCSKPPTS